MPVCSKCRQDKLSFEFNKHHRRRTGECNECRRGREKQEAAQRLSDNAKEQFKCGNFQEAGEVYGKAIHDFPHDNQVVVWLCNAAICSMKQAKFEDAIDNADKAIEKDANYMKAYYQKALALAGQGKPFEGICVLRAALIIDSTSSGLMHLKGELTKQCEAMGEENPLAKESQADDFAQKAEAKLNTRKYEDALNLFAAALKTWPSHAKHASWLCRSAQCNLKLHRPEACLVDSEACLANDPKQVQAHILKSKAWETMGRTLEALHAVRPGLAIEKDNVELLRLEQKLTRECQVGGAKCAVCGAHALKKCQQCKSVHYCGKECQTWHWGTHKSECKLISARCDEVPAPINDGVAGFRLQGFEHNPRWEKVQAKFQECMRAICGVGINRSRGQGYDALKQYAEEILREPSMPFYVRLQVPILGSAVWPCAHWSQTLRAVMYINGHSNKHSNPYEQDRAHPKPDYAEAIRCLRPFATEWPAMRHMMGACFLRLRNYDKAYAELSSTGLDASLVPLTECLFYMKRFEECANLSARLIDFSARGLADSAEKSIILCTFSLLLHNAPETLRKISPWKDCTSSSLFDAAKKLSQMDQGSYSYPVFETTSSRIFTDAARLHRSHAEIERDQKMAELLEQSWAKVGIVPDGLHEMTEALRNGDMDQFMHGSGQLKMDAWKERHANIFMQKLEHAAAKRRLESNLFDDFDEFDSLGDEEDEEEDEQDDEEEEAEAEQW